MENHVADQICFYRRQEGLTQEQLAEALGMTPGAVYKWEAGLSQPELAGISRQAWRYREIALSE